jgi:hypothetical protein
MTTPSWREIKWARVPARPDGLWNMIVEHIAGPRLLRISVKDLDKDKNPVAVKWKLAAAEECGANGIIKTAAHTGALNTSAPRGALIAKVGGSTADLADATAVAARRTFTVGAYCVVSLEKTDTGPLFLTMNDDPDSFSNHDGELLVLIEEAPA